MEELKIAQLGQPILRKVAAPASPTEIRSADFQDLVDGMIAAMRKNKGIGLAGPQVFVSKRVFLAAIWPPKEKDGDPGIEVFINPKLSEFSGEKRAAWEGCLSFIEIMALVPRHRSLRVDYLDREGKPKALRLEGLPARVVQHENDHLDGILIIDRAPSTKEIIKTSELDTVMKKGQAVDDD